jgi:hypothetical protein
MTLMDRADTEHATRHSRKRFETFASGESTRAHRALIGTVTLTRAFEFDPNDRSFNRRRVRGYTSATAGLLDAQARVRFAGRGDGE